MCARSNDDKKSSMLKEFLLFIGNATIFITWLRVLYIFIINGFFHNMDPTICTNTLRPRIIQALAVSSIELFNSLSGLTKSKFHQVLLFASVRTGVELLAAPELPCTHPTHLVTTLCWALDAIRFGCFGLDALFNLIGIGNIPLVKSIRYTIGPMIFPIGALGEMMMVLMIAMKTGRWSIYFAASLWPLGFYPLMKSLLYARKKHFQRLRNAAAVSTAVQVKKNM
jgi:hypothetical protein